MSNDINRISKCDVAKSRLILSLFPGVGLLDMAFEEIGYCVVRGPDMIWGGDIRTFHPPSGVFWGVIGGPPCQEFSGLNRNPAVKRGVEMLGEFCRSVTEARPEWWIMENVARVPNVTRLVKSAGYVTQRFDINQSWYCDVSRLRHIQFGSLSGRLLDVGHRSVTGNKQPAALANDSRGFRELCRLQGLPDDFDLPGMTVKGKKRAVGNGVPLQMGRILANAVKDAYAAPVTYCRRCKCGCGRAVTGKALYDNPACRKRAQRIRDLTGIRDLTESSHARGNNGYEYLKGE